MDIPATRLETDEEIRQALVKYRPARPPGVAVQREPAPADDSPPLFRPTQRPATPLLLVLDDGSEEGELIRIRGDAFAIGRSEGDLIVAHDSQISGRHAELRATVSKDKRRWHLADLSSTNGTYVRVSHAALEHGQEFIVGRTRFRFEQPQADDAKKVPPGPAAGATRPWQSGPQNPLTPALVEVVATGSGRRTLIAEKELWIGKDPGYCQAVLTDDPFASARHARIHRDDAGRWVVENNKSLNGVWLRIKRLAIHDSCRFLLGEQQFLVRIPH
jgi:pSer/pThr/pTyr-binding forkhead associated (FHA) protein